MTRPGDLDGRDIGVLRYGMTMAVWARALLQEQGVAPGAVHWWLGESWDRPPPGISLRGIVDGAEALWFCAARDRAEAALLDPSVSPCPVPWLWAYAEEVGARLGNRLRPYGLAANRATLEAFGAAMADQGLTRRRLAPEEVFALGGNEAP